MTKTLKVCPPYIKVAMSEEIKLIHSKLVSLETEVSDLRQGYIIINRRYTNALTTLKDSLRVVSALV